MEIIAEKQELLNLNDSSLQTADSKNKVICLMTGNRCIPTLVGTPINSIGGTNPKLISFQKDSGYDSYGKEQGENAPISKEAEFAYSTALKHLLDRDSRNRFSLSTATFVFWGSSDSEATKVTEEAFLMFIDDKKGTDPNANIESVQKVFNAIFSGLLKTSL
uniref:type I-C CRISPR-associated protein Cas8c/Csd1 n=2 Tax=Candidatus Limisoma sp. TaxID=3076476 RepID=UPI003FF14711